MKIPFSWLSFALIHIFINFSLQYTLEEELTLTYEQKTKLDKLKELVVSRLPHDYMKEDLYLLRFLRVKYFDVPAAEKMIMENIKWRKENDIDNILNEDWSDFDQEYKISVEGCDRQGRPVVSTIVGDWDIRKAVVTNKMQRMIRYTDKLLEEATVLVRSLQKEGGQNVTNFIEIFDANHFNFANHGCAQCLSIYAYAFQSYEQHYPLSVHKSFTVNTPVYFNSVFQLLKPLLSQHTRDIISIYGRDKLQWQKALLKEISEDNLSKSYGGAKSESWDIEDIRRDNTIYECKIGGKAVDLGHNSLKRQAKPN